MDSTPYSTLEVARPPSHLFSDKASITDKEAGRSQTQRNAWVDADLKRTRGRDGKIMGLSRRNFFILVCAVTLVVAVSASVAGSLAATRMSSMNMVDSLINSKRPTPTPTTPSSIQTTSSIDVSSSSSSALEVPLSTPSPSDPFATVSLQPTSPQPQVPTPDATSLYFSVPILASTTTSTSTLDAVDSFGSMTVIKTIPSSTSQLTWRETITGIGNTTKPSAPSSTGPSSILLPTNIGGPCASFWGGDCVCLEPNRCKDMGNTPVQGAPNNKPCPNDPNLMGCIPNV